MITVEDLVRAYNPYVYFTGLNKLAKENVLLKSQLAQYQKMIHDMRHLIEENKNLKSMVNFTRPLVEVKYVSARLCAISSGPYTRSALIEAGAKNGISVGQIAIDSQGAVVGKVIKVYDDFSQLLLIQDVNSRVSVVTENNVRCIIAGCNDAQLVKVLYLDNNSIIKVGEVLFTLSDSKSYNRGLPIARIVKISNDSVYAEPLANLQDLTLVSIIQVEMIDLLIKKTQKAN